MCGKTKLINNFYKHPTNKDKLFSYCKPCHKERGDVVRRKRRYGLSEETYNDLWVAAASKCAICATTLSRDDAGHAIDHNHKTGKVRGLLCARCNRGLGFFQDNPAFLESATAYLKVRGHYGGA